MTKKIKSVFGNTEVRSYYVFEHARMYIFIKVNVRYESFDKF